MNYKKRVILTSLLVLLAVLFIQPFGQVYASEINQTETTTATVAKEEVVDALEFNLNINKNQTNNRTQFAVDNMFPGDKIHHKYNINIACKSSLTLRFKPAIDTNDKLSEVLNVRIAYTDTNKVLYDGLIKNAPDSLDFKIETDKTITKKVPYIITTYLDTSVGNEYMGEGADVVFEWWVNETDALDDGPKTGDDFNIALWAGLMLVSVCGVVVLIIKMKKGEKKSDK